MSAQPQGRQVPIHRTMSTNLPLVFVNDLLVTNSPNEMFLVFSELVPPIIMSQDDINKVDAVEAKAVFRFVITPAFATAIVKILSEQLAKRKDNSGAR